ncbi:BON domain-containing protein [Paraburkholderia strydomiana]|jgi:osmotically-inducible protein OsmY|uniref:BON domain-containing protein n=1 Tax=Paraburkholderia strydomiana TaxID=1245417 RepID=UPI0038B93231
MKKTIASVLCISYIAFGVAAHAADSGYTPPVGEHVSKPGYFGPARKAERASDRALAKKVRVALTKTKGLDISNVTVLARKGDVTLDGTVPDDRQVQLAQNGAEGVEGVSSLKNNLITGFAGH